MFWDIDNDLASPFDQFSWNCDCNSLFGEQSCEEEDRTQQSAPPEAPEECGGMSSVLGGSSFMGPGCEGNFAPASRCLDMFKPSFFLKKKSSSSVRRKKSWNFEVHNVVSGDQLESIVREVNANSEKAHVQYDEKNKVVYGYIFMSEEMIKCLMERKFGSNWA